MLDNWRTIYQAAGASAGDRVFFAFSFGPFLGFWTSFEAAAKLGCSVSPEGTQQRSPDVRDHRDRCHHSMLHLTYALRLGQAGSAARRFGTIIVAGEPGGSIPSTRAQIENFGLALASLIITA